jgi:metal-sulfur cluster biosynthetic enzyme
MSEIYNFEEIREKVIENLKNVFDPEIPVNVYDLGLIYEINFEEKENNLYSVIYMTLTSPACPVAGTIMEQVKLVALAVDEIDEVKVHITFSPRWTNEMVSEEGKEIMAASGAVI